MTAPSTKIIEPAMRICESAELPDDWAAQLGRLLVPRLNAEQAQHLQERVVGLGHGIMLAHLRSPLVNEPTLGAFKAREATDEGQEWLWLTVLIPQADAAKHLGWMAHLAACLHDDNDRLAVLTADSPLNLARALEQMLSVKTHRYNSGVRLAPGTSKRIEEQDSGSSDQRLAANVAPNKLVVAILKEEAFVDDLLNLFVEHDVRGATILEARGMAEHLAAHTSLFAGFKSAFKAVGHSQVIMTVVPNSRVDEVLEMVRIAAGGMETPGAGIAFALDVPKVIGLGKS